MRFPFLLIFIIYAPSASPRELYSPRTPRAVDVAVSPNNIQLDIMPAAVITSNNISRFDLIHTSCKDKLKYRFGVVIFCLLCVVICILLGAIGTRIYAITNRIITSYKSAGNNITNITNAII